MNARPLESIAQVYERNAARGRMIDRLFGWACVAVACGISLMLIYSGT